MEQTLQVSSKRFLFVIGFPAPSPNAGWRRIGYLANFFSKKRHKCYVLSTISPRSIKIPKTIRENGVIIYNLIPSICIENPLLVFLHNVLTLLLSIPIYLVIRPDTIFVSVPPVNQFLAMFILSRMTRKRFVTDYRDEYEDYVLMKARKSRIIYLFLKKLLTLTFIRSTLVTTVTPALAEGLKKRGISNVKIIHDGVDITTFRPMNKSEARSALGLSMDDFITVYSGSVYGPYRVDIVMKGLERLVKTKSRRCIFLMMGGGNVASVLELARKLGIASNVKYLGVMRDPNDVAKTLCCGDVGVIPYDDSPLWKRTYSTKFFEYCACGLPVIATVHEDSVLATLINRNGVGLTTPPLDSEALAAALEKMRLDSELRLTISQRAVKLVQTSYDKLRIAEDLLRTLTEKSCRT